MADSFSERLWRYLRQTKQRWETLAAKTELPPQVVRRLLYLDEEPPQYVLDRLSRVTGENWGGTAIANETFEKPLPAEAEGFNAAFFRSSTNQEERAENPFGEIPIMTADTSKKETIHDLFADFKKSSATSNNLPEVSTETVEESADINTEKENLREHIRIGVRLSGSASKFAKQLGTTSVTVSNWLTRYYPRDNFYGAIASALGVSVEDLFEPPSAELRAKLEHAPRMRGNLKHGAALFGESAYRKDTLKDLSDSADEMQSDMQPDVPSAPSGFANFDIEEPATESTETLQAASTPVDFASNEESQPSNQVKEETPQAISVSAPERVQRYSASEIEDFSDDEERQPRFLNDIPLASAFIPEPVEQSTRVQMPAGKGKNVSPEAKTISGKDKSKDRDEFGGDIADLIPDGSQSQTALSDRLTEFMNTHEMSLGELTMKMPRRRKDIMRLQTLVLGRSTPRPRELTALSEVLGLPEEQLRIEACLPGRMIRELSLFGSVLAKHGFQQTSATENPAEKESVEAKTADSSVIASSARVLSKAQRTRIGTRSEIVSAKDPELEPRGITALEFGMGSLDFAVGKGNTILYTVTDSELAPYFTPETAVVIKTEGFDQSVATLSGYLKEDGWYLLSGTGGRRLLRHVTVEDTAFTVDKGDGRERKEEHSLYIIGRAVATVAATIL